MKKIILTVLTVLIATQAWAVFEQPEKSEAEVLKDYGIEVTRDAEKLYYGTNARHENLFRKIWCSREHAPQEIFDVLPVQTRAFLFAMSGGLQQVLATNPEYVPLIPPYLYEVNEQTWDITVGEANPEGYSCDEEDILE